ncbi:outer membrane beta-barrel protein [Sphingobacterium paludis]|uniref:Outer membrane protein with beta-barrel domain n=1 Tax=Sphingobacterium paludis TaxID=1476465 RepID=A0A4R7D3T7_9SPHI|nr:outer membrane beta-barrel protein [Sphingobacterium paludis]TDS15719.1 outer membrane protein with beta-barrel domain [Sphingobacterium paludis]
MAPFFKILFFPILFLLLTVHSVKAQYYNYDRNMSLGLTFSPNVGWLNYEDGSSFDGEPKLGYAYGLIADLGFARNYYFSTGLLINTLYSGSKLPLDGATGTLNNVFRLQYAEVPLAIKLKTNEGGAGRFYGQFGFTAGVKVSGKERLESSTDYRAIEGDDIFRLGLLIGAGAEWRISNSLSALTGLSYNNGFTRTMKSGNPRLSYASFNIGLLF